MVRCLLITLVTLWTMGSTTGQDAKPEIWYGVLDVQVVKLRLEIHVAKSTDGNYSGSMFSIDQGNAEMKFDEFEFDNKTMSFKINSVKAAYEGQLDKSGNVVEGTFTQLGKQTSVRFERKQKTAIPDHVETWQGTMDAGARQFEFQLRVFETSDGQRSMLLDSFNESLAGLPAVLDESDGFKFSVPSAQATYEGELSDDRTSIAGQWQQGTAQLDLDFNSVPLSQTRLLKVNRPQTPKPPFDYESIDVSVKSTVDKQVNLAGTLTLPKGNQKVPAVILISGSGPQDRDCNIYEHKSFLVIADYFAQNGIAVLRYDERGVGDSKGNFADATSEDFARDVEDLLQYLKNQPRTDSNKLVLIGHSEGGIIAPMIASRRDDVSGIVILAGPTVTGERIVMNQTRKIAETAGASKIIVDAQDKLLQRVIEQIKTGKLSTEFIDSVIEQVRSELPEEDRAQFVIPPSEKARIAGMDSPWFRFFLKYDPAIALRKVKCPILMITGKNDLQVDPVLNLPIAEKIFAERPNKDWEVVPMPELNHLFQNCETGSPAEYPQIEETFSPVVLDKMIDWIGKLKFGN